METIIRNVKNIDADERRYLESTLGKQLESNQQVIIRVINVGIEPDRQTRDGELDGAAAIGRKGRENAASQGVTEAEVDAAIDEAIAHYRQAKP